MSKTKSVLTDVLETVSAETDVPVGKIMSRCSEEEVVDARWMCVKLLQGRVCYTSRIAELMGITPRYVQYILTDFENRLGCSAAMRNNYERMVNKLRNGGERSAYGGDG